MAPDQTARRFTLLDLMILTAALAAGLALIRATGLDQIGFADAKDSDGVRSLIWRSVVAFWIGTAPLAPALLLIQLRSPRRHRRRATWFRPGIAACAALTGVFAVWGAYFLANLVALGPERADSLRFIVGPADLFGFLEGPRVVFAILGTWSSLILTGAWRPERSWPDRVGLLYASLWIIGYLAIRTVQILGSG